MRLIDANELKVNASDFNTYADYSMVFDMVDNAPTIEAEPVRHAEWEWFEEWSPSTPDNPRECEDCGWQCSRCETALEDMVGGLWGEYENKPDLKYCPECGAKMDGGAD